MRFRGPNYLTRDFPVSGGFSGIILSHEFRGVGGFTRKSRERGILTKSGEIFTYYVLDISYVILLIKSFHHSISYLLARKMITLVNVP